jgi:hypothetical protein
LSAPNSNSRLAVKKRIEQGLGDNPILRVMQLWYLACPAHPSSPCTDSACPGRQMLDDNPWTTQIAAPPGEWERQPAALYPDLAKNLPDMPI